MFSQQSQVVNGLKPTKITGEFNGVTGTSSSMVNTSINISQNWTCRWYYVVKRQFSQMIVVSNSIHAFSRDKWIHARHEASWKRQNSLHPLLLIFHLP